MREALATSQKIMAKLKDLEEKFGTHDAQIQEIVEALQEMMTPPAAKGRKIGFEIPIANLRSQIATSNQSARTKR